MQMEKTMKLPRHSRYDYSAIIKRPVYEWPNGTRLAVVLYNNIEHFAFRSGLGSDSTTGTAPQTQRNYAWRDYGNRVGIWNYLDLLDEYDLAGSHNVNSAAIEECPDIVERLNARGDEYIGHGRSNSERQDEMWEEDEVRLIAECTEVLTRLSGKKPQGWMGPYFAESSCTLDLLKEAGYTYVLDWPADDQPFWMRTRSGPILSIPYPVEINDSPALIFRQHSAREFADMMVDQFIEMLRIASKRPVVYSISVHPFIIGQPFRLHALRGALEQSLVHRDEIWITRPGEISRHCAGFPKGIIPGS
jgi:allantoinase